MEVTLFINGKPFGKQRPRFASGHAYTPKETREYEQRIKNVWKAKKLPMMDGYINLYIEANYPVPEYDAKWKKAAKLMGVLFPGKPDADNIGKICADALNGLAFPDDSRVTLLTIAKKYSDYAGVRVTITSTEPIEERIEKFKKEHRNIIFNREWTYDRKRD